MQSGGKNELFFYNKPCSTVLTGIPLYCFEQSNRVCGYSSELLEFLTQLWNCPNFIVNLQSIFSSRGALGWNTESARANSSNPRIPLCFVSNKSNTCKNRGGKGLFSNKME